MIFIQLFVWLVIPELRFNGHISLSIIIQNNFTKGIFFSSYIPDPLQEIMSIFTLNKTYVSIQACKVEKI